jgi:hypothetical protein
MPYDPQRSHRRPRLADDAPAPIDALLGNGAEPDPQRSASAPDSTEAIEVEVTEVEVVEVTEVEVVEVATVDAAAAVDQVAPPTHAPDVEVDLAPERGRPRLAALAVAALLFVVLVLAWVRRRR